MVLALLLLGAVPARATFQWVRKRLVNDMILLEFLIMECSAIARHEQYKLSPTTTRQTIDRVERTREDS